MLITLAGRVTTKTQRFIIPHLLRSFFANETREKLLTVANAHTIVYDRSIVLVYVIIKIFKLKAKTSLTSYHQNNIYFNNNGSGSLKTTKRCKYNNVFCV